tara:strand:- start:15532 stop:16815 length:1284 start_codon:yes stop_codon:yes gene_type:complete
MVKTNKHVKNPNRKNPSRRRRRILLKKHSGGNNKEYHINTLKEIISCYKNIDQKSKTIFSIPYLVENCKNITVLRLIKLSKFLTKQLKINNNYNSVIPLIDIINDFKKTVTTNRNIIGGMRGKYLIGLFITALTLSDASYIPPKNLRTNQNRQDQIHLTKYTDNNDSYGSFEVYDNNEVPLHSITHGQEGNIDIYENYVIKTFKDSAEANANDNYKNELSGIELVDSISKVNSEFTKPIQLLDKDDSALIIKIEKFDSDAVPITISYKADPNDWKGDKFAVFDPAKVDYNEIQNFKRDIDILHNNGIAHGDIHNGNIALRYDNNNRELVLFDYGNAISNPMMHGNEELIEIVNDMYGAENPFYATTQSEYEDIMTMQKGQRKWMKSIRNKTTAEKKSLEQFKKNYEDFLEAKNYDLSQYTTLTSSFT